jgi:hypothetical protein
MGVKQIQITESVDEHTFENLTEVEKQTIATELKLFDTQVVDGLKNNNSVISRLFFATQKDIFVHWTESLEKLYYLGQYPDPIHTISTYIKKQLGKCRFSDEEVEDAVRHEQLYDTMKHSIAERFKDPDYRHTQRGTESLENTSDFTNTPDQIFFLEGLQLFRFYHRRFADIADDFIEKLADPQIFQDLAEITEWQEIGLFSHYLGELASEHGLLDQIEDEQNLKESATVLQRAMFKILYADGGYRQMAYKFGISPRQNQRIRQRDQEWPKKDIKDTIMKIQGSYLCGCGCGYNIVSQKKYHDIQNPKFFPKFQWSEKKIKLPGKAKEILEKNEKLVLADNTKNKRLNPIDIARMLFGKQTKLMVEKAKEYEEQK